MKSMKIAGLLFFVIGFGHAAYADISLGLGGTLGAGVGSVRAGGYENTYGSGDNNLNTLGGFTVSTQVTFGEGMNRFFIRPEAGVLFNNGVGNGFRFTYEDHTIGTANDSACKISVTTVDLPVLLGMETAKDDWLLDYYMGPYVSFPVVGSLETAAGTKDLAFVSPVFGATAGITGNLKAGPGSVYFDARYLFDFSATKMDVKGAGADASVYARRNLVLGAGYKLTL